MKLLALEEIERSHGTVQLIAGTEHLQYAKGTAIVLVPQPTRNDPNDPLNWTFTRRITAYQVVLVMSFLCNFGITGIGPGFGQIMDEFNCSVTQVTWLVTVCYLGLFFGCYVVGPFAVKFGKRPVWLGITLVFLVCNIWASVAKSYVSLLLARLFASMASGASEPMSVGSLFDMFFLHERGRLAGFQGFWLGSGASLAPVISGYLIQAKGWRWYHWLTTILTAATLIATFFLVPETMYGRDLDKALNTAHIGQDMASKPSEELPSPTVQQGKESVEYREHETATLPKRTFLEELKPWSTPNNASLFTALLRPWVVLRYPSIFWVVWANATNFVCVGVLSAMLPVYISSPPYNFGSGSTGLSSLSSVVGNFLGVIACGPLCDLAAKIGAKRNNGIFEPEMRLWVMLIPGTLVPAGFILFGLTVHYELHWMALMVASALISVGSGGVNAIFEPYIMDSYASVAYEAITAVLGFNKIIGFGIGFAVVPWLDRNGPVVVFCVLAALTCFADGLAILVYFKGRGWREKDAKRRIIPF